jgi:hypothetical protein
MRLLLAAALMVVTAAAARAHPACPGPDCGPVAQLSAERQQELQDPFFRLVLAREPEVRRLDRVVELIRGARGSSRIFVVSEEIRDPRLNRSQTRRAVIDFLGTNGEFYLGANVMLSLVFDEAALPAEPELEALAWDERNGVYNYYRSEGPARTWNFRGTSRDADRLTPAQRKDTCLECHTSGAPVMKELLIPWNNWHSAQSEAAYLRPDSFAAEPWPVANELQTLSSAENLMGAIMSAIDRFNDRKFSDLVKRVDGKIVVADAPRVLRPLFATTEINFVSARQSSGMHPVSAPLPANAAPARDINIPNGFFLANSALAGGGVLGNPIGVDAANGFSEIAVIRRQEYKDLIDRFEIKLHTAADARRGDAFFAWFTPEMGFSDAHWIVKLVQEKVVSPGFAAAVLAADLERPIFSDARAKLLDFVPPGFSADPDAAAHPDRLTSEVIARLVAANPPPGTVAGRFLADLQAPDPVQVVRDRVAAYRDRIANDLRSNGAAERERLFGLLIQRRKEVREHPVFGPMFGPLVESDALLPLP